MKQSWKQAGFGGGKIYVHHIFTVFDYSTDTETNST